MDNKPYVAYSTIKSNVYWIILYDLSENKSFKEIKTENTKPITKIKFYFNFYSKEGFLLTHSADEMIILYNLSKDANVELNIKSYPFEGFYGLTMVFQNENSFNIIIGRKSILSSDSEDEKIMIYNQEGNTVGNLNLKTKKIIDDLETYYFGEEIFILVTSFADDIFLYNFKTGEVKSKFKEKRDDENHRCTLIYQKENDLLLILGNNKGTIRIFNIYNKELIAKFETEKCLITSMLLWNQKYLLFGNVKGDIRIIDLEN
ncbi:MAG: hypothetical protein MJ252_08715 [archaeon]|nr:hypothetical protein [archaeon]